MGCIAGNRADIETVGDDSQHKLISHTRNIVSGQLSNALFVKVNALKKILICSRSAKLKDATCRLKITLYTKIGKDLSGRVVTKKIMIRKHVAAV